MWVKINLGGEFDIEMPLNEYITLRAAGKHLEKALPAALLALAGRFLLPLIIRALPTIISLVLPSLIRGGINLLSREGVSSLARNIVSNITRAIPQLSAIIASPAARGVIENFLQNALSNILPTLRGRDVNELSRELAQRLQQFLTGAGGTAAQQALTQALQTLPPQQAGQVTAALGGAVAKSKPKLTLKRRLR